MLLEHLGDARTACVGAWSLRRINDLYNGPVARLRRSTDNVEADFWRGTGKAFYTSTSTTVKQTLTAWLGAATAFVVTWYDQSNAGNHATSSTTAQQPQLVLAPDWSQEPTLRFDGVADFLAFNGAGMVNTDYSVLASFARSSAKVDNYVLGGTGVGTNGNLIVGHRTDTQLAHSQYNVDYNVAVPAFATRTGTVAAARHSSTLGKNTFLNGVTGGTLSNTQPLVSWVGAAVGRIISFFFQGDVSEFVMVAQYLADRERALLETDMMRVVSQAGTPATPLPAMCFSLRQIAGSGPVVRLEQGVQQDDFFARTGVNTLVNAAGLTPETWAGANPIYVHTWYNQVANVHAVATVVGTAVKPTLARENNEYVVRMVNSSSTNGSYLALRAYTWDRTTRGFTSVTRSNKLGNYERVYQVDDGTALRRMILFRHSTGSQLRSLTETAEVYTSATFPTGSATLRTVTARMRATSDATVTIDAWVDATKASAPSTATAPDYTSTRGGIGFTNDAAFFATQDITDAVFFNAALSDLNVDVWRSLVANPRTVPTTTTSDICYSLRRFLGSGPVVRLERGGDAALADFFSRGPGGTLLLNAAGQTPETWAGANAAFVHTWYNQAANANHAVATLAGLATKPTLVRENNEHVIRFVGTSSSVGSYLAMGSVVCNMATQGYTVVSRVNKVQGAGGTGSEPTFFLNVPGTGSGFVRFYMGRDGVTDQIRLVQDRNSSAPRVDLATATGGFPAGSVPLRTLCARIQLTSATATGAASWVNGQKSNNIVTTYATADAVYTVGGIAYSTGSEWFTTMDVSDMMFFNTALSDADVVAWTGLVGNPPPTVVNIPRLMSAGQSCPLDLVSAASRAACRGAYGLRSLSSTYTGPALRVRRLSDSTEADFFAAGDRMLVRLTVGKPETLTSWLAGTVGSLVTWYDQSGAGNHTVVSGGGYRGAINTSKTQGNNPAGLWQLSVSAPFMDSLGDAAAFQGVWSLRNVRSAYTGPLVRVRRSTGGEDDFWRGAGNTFYSATTTLTAWLGAATAFVVTWYDQSGKGNHATQATAASQPELVVSADWSLEPTVRFDGTDDNFPITGTGMVNTDYSVFAVVARSSSKTQNVFLGGSGGTTNTNLILGFWTTTTNFIFSQYSNDIYATVTAYTTRTRLVAAARHSSTMGKNLSLNFASSGSNVNISPVSSWTGASIGRSGSLYFAGDISEIVLMSRYVSDAERSFVGASLTAPPSTRVPANVVVAYDRLTVALTTAATPTVDTPLVLATDSGNTLLTASKFNMSISATGNVQTSVGWETTAGNRSVSTSIATRGTTSRWASVINGSASSIYANGVLQDTGTRTVALPAWAATDEIYIDGPGEVRSLYFFDAALAADQVGLLS
jgi:hypothetical protein